MESLSDIVASMRSGTKLPGYWRSCDLNKILAYHADRIEAAWKRERERDRNLLFRMLWFNAGEYREDWCFKAYQRTIRETCECVGVKYSADGKEIAGALDKTELGKKLSEEVCDGE